MATFERIDSDGDIAAALQGIGNCLDEAYQIMRALAAAKPRDYFVIVQCMLTGNDGREKFVVCFPGTEERLLQERQERIKLGWKVE